MSTEPHPARIRFDSFDLDIQTRELRKNGRPIKLQDQPGKLLALLASRAGELVTRSEIEKTLWREGEFVEFEHAVNTAVRKVREALGDDLDAPRFIETLPRKGYRFIALVEPDGDSAAASIMSADRNSQNASAGTAPEAISSEARGVAFRLPKQLARALFLIVQVGYLAMYGVALYKAEAIEHVLTGAFAGQAVIVGALMVAVIMCGAATRLYLLSSIGFNHPAAGAKFHRLFPGLFVLDALWATSPFLLVPTIGYGLALGAIVPLAYLPFCQRTLVESIYHE